jgi:hypothetical protein
VFFVSYCLCGVAVLQGLKAAMPKEHPKRQSAKCERKDLADRSLAAALTFM